ncbi:chitinase [Allocatelliglobosispora scoriae]|uniref:chitinase n=1 Tax=Allocatelliglobosispora scoriae TaxID=643052 RepID=A0A841C0I3_9ACTN|nr:glycosyl hydrolase family 18 protein [Allocatelliglobosispora scoriae]MBB5872391.1 chitinase [Allocatelliglobosispora scoriae]
MKTFRMAAIAAALASVTTAAVALTIAPAAAAEVITNGGLETGSLSPWTCNGSTGSVVSTPVHGGTKALQGAVTASDNAQCVQTVPTVSGTSYTLTAWVRGNYVYLGVTGGASTWTPSAASYTQLTVTFTASGSSAQVYLHGWYAQGTYQADDISLQGAGGPASPSASPSRSTTPSVSPSASRSPSASPSASPPPPSPSPSTSPQPPTGNLPKHLLTGYWQDFTNGATPLRLSAVPTSYDLIAVAFANANPSQAGGVTFAVDPGLSTALGGYSDAQFKADINTLHARGQRVVISVGGEKGNVSVSSAAAATNFANSVHALMTSYGFDGVDIDLENGLSATYMEQALRSLRSKAGANLIITMAPQTIDMQSTGNEYFKLALNIKDILTIVHTQFYNSGSMLGCDQMFAYSQGTINFLTALACIQLQSALRPDQIALGLPATTQAAGGGYVAPSVVGNALNCLARKTNCGSFVPANAYPTIRGAMTWSINWDASNGYAFANSVHATLITLP